MSKTCLESHLNYGSVIVFVSLLLLLNALRYFHIPVAFGWWTSLRLALTGMFLLTAAAHWDKRRPDLIRMVPEAFPRPDLLVTISGILELVGAALLLFAPTARWGAIGLFLLLFAVFPANVRAARERLSIGGRPVPSLLPRTLIQMAFLAATLAVALGR